MKQSCSVIGLGLLAAALLGSGTAAAGTVTESYAIAVSRSVMDDPAWKAATVDTLKAKYPQATVAVWKTSPDEVRPILSKTLPAYTAFVMKPEEAGVQMTITVSNLCRALDDDPYVDTFWGIITGYDAESAKQLAAAKPIAVKTGLDCASTNIRVFDEAWRYTEDHRGIMNYWKSGPDARQQDIPCDTDNTQGVLERLQKDRVQFLATSGHATQHDWQMGYCGPNMAMIHKDGRLYSVDTKKKLHPAGSTEPKVYIAAGNCLIGDIDKPDCMATSWMKDGGVRQMVGYTVTTWYGAQGWGTLGAFLNPTGMYTANEAFHFTNTGIVDRIKAYGIPDMMTYRMKDIGHQNMPMTPGMSQYLGGLQQAGADKAKMQRAFKDVVGLLHDRDTVVFYGDPALDARVTSNRVLRPFEFRAYTTGLAFGAVAYKGQSYKGALWLRLPGSWDYDISKAMLPKAFGKPDLVLDNMIRFPNAELSDGHHYGLKLQGAKPKCPGTVTLHLTPSRRGKGRPGMKPGTKPGAKPGMKPGMKPGAKPASGKAAR